MNKEINILEVSFKLATKSDLELIMAWRSHPQIYKYFRKQNDPLLWEDHVKFWNSRKNRKDYIIIAHNGLSSHKVGTINFTRLNTESPEIGILIGELSAQGKGLGVRALRLGLDWLKQKGYRKVQANINKANLASNRLFVSTGFLKKLHNADKIWINYEKYL